MKTINGFILGLLSMVAATGFFAASTAFATNGQTISQSEVETVAEVSGDQRIVEIAAPHSPSSCTAESMVTGDQRKQHRQIGGSEGNRVLTPVRTDECTETEYTMPMNR